MGDTFWRSDRSPNHATSGRRVMTAAGERLISSSAMSAPQSPEDQFAFLADGIDTLLPEGELLDRLGEGRPLRVKLGVDPHRARRHARMGRRCSAS